MRFVLAAFATAGCVATPSSSIHPRHSLEGRVAEAPEECVVALPRELLLVVDRRTLSYRVAGTVYRTEVEGECPGLYPGGSIAVHMINGRYCSGDHISVLEAGSSVPRQICSIGPFTPYRKVD